MAEPAKRTRKVLGIAIRLAVAVALIAWLLRTGKLDPTQIRNALAGKPGWVLGAAALYALATFISMVRWWTLLAAQDVRLRARDTIQLSFIGYLFSTFLPGGVTGDVVKAYYISKESHNKTGAVMSILLDRVLGLSTFITLGAGTMLVWLLSGGLGQVDAQHHSKIFGLAASLFAIFTCIVIGWSLLLNRRLRSSRIFNRLLDRLPLSARIRAIYDTVFLYRDKPGHLLAAIALSFCVQVPILLAHYCLGMAAGETALTLGRYLILGALGLVVNSIGLPMGVGSGQVGYMFLFTAFGSTGVVGTTVITLLQAIMICWNQIGWIFYLRGRDKYRAAFQEQAASLLDTGLVQPLEAENDPRH